MTAFYNEIEPYAAHWLRNLIDAGYLPAGPVDTRSIIDVGPDELDYDECHFFAGIGGWPYALQLAGWPADREVWTASCPCQPLSSAGLQQGHADERHLWPAVYRLIAERRPATIFGEQVASRDGREWLSGVRADLEHLGYAVGAADLCAASVGAPHIRQRLFWGALSEIEQYDWSRDARRGRGEFADSRAACGLGEPERARLERHGRDGDGGGQPRRDGAPPDRPAAPPGGAPRGPGDAGQPWQDSVWLPCLDGKARRIESVTPAMVDGLPESLGRVCRDSIDQLEKEVIVNADAGKTDARKAMRDLWLALSAETLRGWPFGRPNGVHEAPILLAFLRQLAEQGWAFSESLSRASAETSEALLRSLWWRGPAARTPCGRGLDEQRSAEYSDLMCVLSSVLARYAQTAWGQTFDAHAASVFPLASGVPARVGRLRAYGNAIVPQVAAEFVRAVMECIR